MIMERNLFQQEGVVVQFPKCKFVDLSIPIKTPNPEEMNPALAESLAAVIQYLDHEDTSQLVQNYFGCKRDDLMGGLGWATERIRTSSHAGTHVDAPYHYYPVCNGQPARTIDECPLEWYFGEGVVLNMTHKKPGETVSAQDVEDELKRIGHELKQGDIVCVRFDTDKTFGTWEYWNSHPGMSAESVRYILDRGVKVIGVDSPGFDIPFCMTKEKFAQTGDTSLLWEAHHAGIDYDYSHIEKLANLDQIPQTNFYVACFPVSLYRGSASWARVVAFIPEEE